MKRREFIKTSLGTTALGCMFGRIGLSGVNERDITYDPNVPLESTGLRVRDVVEILKKGEADNIAPVLREEILDNPNAVFIINANIKAERDENGNWKPCNDQMERLGKRVAELLFRKGTVKGGRTFINPNMVDGLRQPNSPYINGEIVHPYFTVGLTDALRDIGSTNNAIGARGALRHNHFVQSGLIDLFNAHNLPLLEAHVQFYKDYYPSELMWFDNPKGKVQQRIYAYHPVYDKGTTFINIAHAHTHPFGHTTLTLKNLQGIMPRGWGHICDAWCTVDIWRKDLMNDFDEDFRPYIEKMFVKHGEMGYKHWDYGGYYKQYVDNGGYKAFKKAHKAIEGKKGDDFQKALNKIYDIADSRLFLAEQWSQRMMDNAEALPPSFVNMVEGVFAYGDEPGIVHSDFVTVGRSTIAVDAVTSWLMGHDPRELPYLRIAKERGLGDNDIENIPIFFLDEKGVSRVASYDTLKRNKLGIYIYRLKDLGAQYF